MVRALREKSRLGFTLLGLIAPILARRELA